jgi:prepilin signal peptidase PulO-like enzyme (type II secretory pathway)
MYVLILCQKIWTWTRTPQFPILYPVLLSYYTAVHMCVSYCSSPLSFLLPIICILTMMCIFFNILALMKCCQPLLLTEIYCKATSTSVLISFFVPSLNYMYINYDEYFLWKFWTMVCFNPMSIFFNLN